jgi:ribosomal protein S18 acetylase RimI-like enzyme
MTALSMDRGEVEFTRARPTGEETIALARAAGLNGPLESPARMQRMVDEAQYVEVARLHGELIGFIRVLTDGAYNAFVSDLAVHPDHQHRGIGTRLMRAALEADPQVKFILDATSASAGFYRRFGFVETSVLVRPRTANT